MGTVIEPSPVGGRSVNAEAAARKQATTLELWSSVLRVHVVPRIGSMRCSSVTAEQVEQHYAELSLRGKAVHHGKAGTCRTAGVTCSAFDGCGPEQHQGLSPAMVRHVHTALRAVLRRSLGYRAALPTDASRAREALPGQGTSRVDPEDYWTDDQAKAFLSATTEEKFSTAFAVALATGLRRSEILGAINWSA